MLPERGEIGIFNRSHYEDVLVVRVEELVPKQIWKKRYAAINAFEQHLGNEGTTVVKLFLNISLESRRSAFRSGSTIRGRTGSSGRRSQEACALGRLHDRLSRDARAHVDEGRALARRPGRPQWVRDAVVTEVLTQTLEGLDPEWPEIAPELRGLVVQ